MNRLVYDERALLARVSTVRALAATEMPLHRTLALLLVLTVGCSRAGRKREGDGGADGTTAAAPPIAAPVSTPSRSSAPHRAHVSGGVGSGLEARRSRVAHVGADPILSANAEALRKQHHGAIPAVLAVQATDLGADRRRALLVGAERKDASLENPMVLVVDDKGALVWSKERPAAGITPPIGPSAIAAGPSGRFALAVSDPPTSSVALRLWDADGSPFADFHVLQAKSVGALSLLHWPGHGWLIAVSVGGETRVQMLTSAGGLAWGAGRVLGARFRTIAPVTLASDSSSSFILVQYSQSPGVDRDVDHAVAFRYDEKGEPLWAAPTDLGAVRRITPGQERIALTKTSDGVLRAHLVGKVSVEIRSNGETRRVP